MNASEKRGLRQLVDPPKSRAKTFVTAYVIYESQGGERLAYEVSVSRGHLARMREKESLLPNIVHHTVELSPMGLRVVGAL